MDMDDNKAMLLALGATAIAGFAALAYSSSSTTAEAEVAKPKRRKSKRSSKKRNEEAESQSAGEAAAESSPEQEQVKQPKAKSTKKKRKHKGKKKRKGGADKAAPKIAVDADDLIGTYEDDGRNPDSWTLKAKPEPKASSQPAKKSAEKGAAQAYKASFSMDLGDKVSMVIGKRGATIMSIQDETGANLSIDKSTSELTITGTDQQVAAAKELVLSKTQAPARGGGGSRSRQHACTASMDVGNRAGAIIGRGGVTIRQIQDDSGASLDIQRQDGSDQASVTINADDEESIEKAKQMIADILSGSGGGGGGGGGSYAEPVSMDLGSRHNCFGIIGKGGLKIRELEQKSGARLSVNKDEFTVEIVGTEEAIKSARGLIAAALATLTNASKVTTITLTRDNVGAVIGKGGATIRDIQAKSGARLDIQRDNRDSAEVTVDIVGTTEAVAVAVAMVKEVTERPRGPPRNALKEGETEVTVELGRAVGSVIGRGGQTIAKIQSESGARLDIDKGTSKCRIYGQPEAVEKAQTEVEAIVKRIKEGDAKKAEQKAQREAAGHKTTEATAENFEAGEDKAAPQQQAPEGDWEAPVEGW